MGDINNLITGIELKVKKLTDLLRQRETESSKLKNERDALLIKIDEQRTQIQQLEEKYQKLQMANALTRKDDVASVKLRINELVREVDRCLGLLNK